MKLSIDDIVNDPRFLPYRGWHDAYLTEEEARGKTGPAIQQIRSEYCEFLEHMQKVPINDSCLQIGLGQPGASHVCLSNFFADTWSIEIDPTIARFHVERIAESKNIIVGSSFDFEMRRFFAARQFDLLFIDGDHRYAAVKMDFQNYFPLVRDGGIVAFHDTIAYSHYDENIPSCTIRGRAAEILHYS